MQQQDSLNPGENVKGPFIVEQIDKFILFIGKYLSLLSVLLVMVILTQVILRYGFSSGLVKLEELQWWLYSVLVMNAIAFDVAEDNHVRMDLFYNNFSDGTKNWINIISIVIFGLPISVLLAIKGVDLAQMAYAVKESSQAPEGFSNIWIIKSVLPITMILYAVAQVSRLIRLFIIVFRSREN